MTNSKNVLMIAPYFVPRRRVGALRPFKFATHLRDQGWNPTVLTLETPGGVLTPAEERLLEGITVLKVSSPFDFTGRSGSQMKSGKHSSARTDQRGGIVEKLSDRIDKHFPIDTWLPLFRIKMRTIKAMIRLAAPDLIWSTGDPWSSHWLAYRLQKEFTLPWVADFRDPWTLSNVNLKQRSAFSASIDERWERRIVRRADWLTFTSESTRSMYQDAYPEQSGSCSCIYNAYDRSLYEAASEQRSGGTGLSLKQSGLNLVFWGRFRELSPATPVIDILAAARDIDPAARRIVIHSFGPLGERDRLHAERRGVLKNFVSHEPRPPEQALAVLNEADLLLLSTDPARTDIIPAKLWDYLAAERPVLSVAPNPEIADILEQTGAGVQMSLADRTLVASYLLRSLSARERGQTVPGMPDRNAEAIRKYGAGYTTRRLAEIFDRIS